MYKSFFNDETLTQRECKPEDNGTTSLKNTEGEETANL